MGQTSPDSIPYPEPASSVDVPRDIRAAVERIQTLLLGLPHIQMGNYVLQTDGSGRFTFNFPVAFASQPVVVLTDGDASADDLWDYGVDVHDRFSVTGVARSALNGSAVGNWGIRVMWIAIGPR